MWLMVGLLIGLGPEIIQVAGHFQWENYVMVGSPSLGDLQMMG